MTGHEITEDRVPQCTCCPERKLLKVSCSCGWSQHFYSGETERGYADAAVTRHLLEARP